MATRLPYYTGQDDIYSRLMAQFENAQPYYSESPYGEGYTGGYDPSLYSRFRPTTPLPFFTDSDAGLLGDSNLGPSDTSQQPGQTTPGNLSGLLSSFGSAISPGAATPSGNVSTGIGGITLSPAGLATPNVISTPLATAAGALLGLPLGLLSTAMNQKATQAAAAFNSSVADTMGSNVGLTPAATAGPTGTGAQAAISASNAAAAASQAGFPVEAQAQAAQAAANAVISGLTPQEAANIGLATGVASGSVNPDVAFAQALEDIQAGQSMQAALAAPVVAETVTQTATPEAVIATPEAVIATPEAVIATPEAAIATPEAAIATPVTTSDITGTDIGGLLSSIAEVAAPVEAAVTAPVAAEVSPGGLLSEVAAPVSGTTAAAVDDFGTYGENVAPVSDTSVVSAVDSFGTYGENAPPDGGGGGGGASKIICTKLYQLGLMPKNIYEADQAFGKELVKQHPQTYAGYVLWAGKIVQWMDRKDVFGKFVITITKQIATPWSFAMAQEMGVDVKSNWFGRFLLKRGLQFCQIIGQMKTRSIENV